MKRYLIALALLVALVATPALAAENNQALIQSLIKQIQQLTKQVEQLLAQKSVKSPAAASKDGVSLTNVGVVFGLTPKAILNSNGFVNGKKQIDEHSYHYISDIVLADLDKDGASEAVATYTTCGASCGMEIMAFKSVGTKILTVILPDSQVAGAAQKIDSLYVSSDGLVRVAETDFGGIRASKYKVYLEDGVLKTDKDNSLDLSSVTWQTTIDAVNHLSFMYPGSLSPACAELQQRPTVTITPLGSSKIDSSGCLPAQAERAPKSEKITLGGRDFCLSVGSDAGAGQLYREYLYTTLAKSNYYTLDYVVHTSNGCGVYQNSNDINSPDNARYRACLACAGNYDNVVIPLIQNSASSLRFTN